MNNILNKTKSSVLALCLAMSFSQVNAALISFGGQGADDGSVETSAEVGAGDWIDAFGNPSLDITNIIDPNSGFFIETFDQNTANPAPELAGGLYDEDNARAADLGKINIETDGCGINSYGALAFSADDGGLGVRKGNVGYAAHNNANSTCFGFTPRQGITTSEITVDYSAFLANLGPLGAGGIDYFGIYFGSVDWYNFFEFGHIVDGVFEAFNLSFGNGDSILDGTEILNEIEAQSGDRDGANTYMNITFGANEQFTAFRMRTERVALEIDNIVVGLANRIPEPTTLAIFGLGLLALGLRKGFR